jgi:uncharacterized integral membrane protein (TIGR00697 family)
MKEKFKSFFKTDRPISVLQIILTIVFVGTLLVSNIISSRIFNFFGFSMTAAVIVFPITYILSDLFSEVYGYKWSRLTCYLAFGLNFIAVLIFFLVSILPVHPYGVEVAESFKTILTGSFACSMASFIAFVVGDFCNDKVFAKMKLNHQGLRNHKGFAGRAILSSFIGELADSCIYLPLAFLVFNPIMTISDVLVMIALQVGLKTLYEALILPLTTFLTKKVANYEYKLNYKEKEHQIDINEWLDSQEKCCDPNCNCSCKEENNEE